MTLVFIVVGLGAGVLSGFFGIGGGLVIVPALVYLAKFPLQTATGTSLAALLLPVGALGALQYYKGGHLNIAAALWIAAGLLLGAGLGARLALTMSPDTLRRLFAVFLAVMAVRMWLR
jgi:uncharacterized protein